MKLVHITVAIVLMTMLSSSALAEHSSSHAGEPSLWERDTLTNNWFGLGESLNESGVAINLSLTQILQNNLAKGRSTHRRAGRYTGSYDLEFELDTETLFQLPGGTIYAHVEGSWSDGIDASSVGSLFGVNGDAAGDRSIDLTELWYEQALLGDNLRIRVGKLDLTGGFQYRGYPLSFDGSSYANDETAQFMNGALVNNPTIPFPDRGLGLVLYYQPLDWLYFGAGVADAQADDRETGFNTTFHQEDYFFSIYEMGVTPQLGSPSGPLQGAYRVGFWYDPQDKEKFDGGNIRRDDLGFYLSFDQKIMNENSQDDQGLGMFARYGYAHKQVNEIRCFFSVGAQYQGLIPNRDDDVLGFGVAQGRLSPDAFSVSRETAFELYYNSAITGWLSITQSIQYIKNPGGDPAVDEATVIGLRAQMSF